MEPQNSLVLVLIAVRIFDRQECLAYPSQPIECLCSCVCRLLRSKIAVERREDVVSIREKRIAPVGKRKERKPWRFYRSQRASQTMCKFLNHPVHAFRHIRQGQVQIFPDTHCFAIRRQEDMLYERKSYPCGRAQKNGDDLCLPDRVLFESTRHFYLEALVRGKKISANQQDNNVRRPDKGLNSTSDLAACTNHAIVAHVNETPPLQHDQMFLQFLKQGMILGGKRKENVDWPLKSVEESRRADTSQCCLSTSTLERCLFYHFHCSMD